MAMMKYGRFKPKTEDPITRARVADPDVYGKKLPGDGGTVSSWPDIRKMYQEKKLDTEFFGEGGTKEKPTGGRYSSLPKEVRDYLEGATDRLDDKTYEEPIIQQVGNIGSTKKNIALQLDFRKGSKQYNKAIQGVPGWKSYKPSQEGLDRQVDIGVKFGSGESFGVSSLREQKKEDKTEDPTPPTPTPPKPKKPIEEVETKNVGVTDYSYEAPSKSYKTTKTVLGTKITKKGKTVPALRKVEVQPIHGAKVKDEGRYYREKKLAEVYMSGEYGGESFRGKTKEEMKGILQKARQDKRASMEAGEWSEAKYGVKQARQAKRYAGRENVTGVTSSPEMVTPKTQVQEKYYTGNLKDEQGNIVGQSKKGARPKMNEEGFNYWTQALDGDKKMPSGYNVLSTSDQKQSKNKYYTASNLKGYSGSYEDISKQETFRNQRENAANRNTIFGQLATLNNKMRERVGAKPIQRATKRSEKITE
jgi:hypothetical protein